MSTRKYQQVAAIVREQITDGTLAPRAPAPSGAALSRVTRYSVVTCRRALRSLITAGVLLPGASPNARPRVPGANHDGQTLANAKRALSAALAEHRHAAGLTQPQLAELIGLSVTSIGHAETGRTWQSRPFWELADKALNADDELLRLHDAYRAAEVTESEDIPLESGGSSTETDTTETPATVIVDVPAPVNCITISWANGAVTSIYPPAVPQRPRPEAQSTDHIDQPSHMADHG